MSTHFDDEFYNVLYGFKYDPITLLGGGFSISFYARLALALKAEIFPNKLRFLEKLKAFMRDPCVVKTTDKGIFGPFVIFSF